MKTLRFLALALSATLAFSNARGTTVIPPTFDELVGQAELIFQGTVSEVKSQWIGEGAQRHIVSYVTVQVEDSIKGDAGQSYTLRMLGGTVGEETMEVSDSPKFQVGDREVLFVQNNGKQFIPLVGIMHGRFHVEQDNTTGANMVLTNSGSTLTNLQNLGRDESAGASKSAATNAIERPLDVDAFKAAIRSKLADVR
jgi:hypothetical protein